MIIFLSIVFVVATSYSLLFFGYAIYDAWYHKKYGYPYYVVYGKRQDGMMYYCSRDYISDKPINTFKDLELVDKRLKKLDGVSEVIIFNIMPLDGHSKYKD